MSRFITSTLAISALTGATLVGAAEAADLPTRAYAPAVVAPVAYNWTGLYAGLNAGYGFDGRNRVTTTGLAPNNVTNVAVGARPGSFRLDPDGFIGGGQIGYNWQFGGFVAGAEADIAYTDFRSTRSYLGVIGAPVALPSGAILAAGSYPATFRQRLDYLGTVRARLGFAMDRTLIYVTGGLAYGDVRNSASFFTPAGALQFAGSRSRTKAGYTVGGGIEYAVTNNISVKAEYLYYDLGSSRVTVAAIPGVGTGGYSSRFRNDGHIVRAGLNFKF